MVMYNEFMYVQIHKAHIQLCPSSLPEVVLPGQVHRPTAPVRCMGSAMKCYVSNSQIPRRTQAEQNLRINYTIKNIEMCFWYLYPLGVDYLSGALCV